METQVWEVRYFDGEYPAYVEVEAKEVVFVEQVGHKMTFMADNVKFSVYGDCYYHVKVVEPGKVNFTR